MQAKYSEGYFKIPYTQQFYNRYISMIYPLTTNQELMLQLVDRISGLPPNQYKNQLIFPVIPKTNVNFIIMSYAFPLHKAKVLMKRLSRVGFIMTTCQDDWAAEYDMFVRKRVDIPISSNQTFVLCSNEFEKFYSVREMINTLAASEHKDVNAMRTICPISNLSRLKNLRTLHHPYLFTSFNKSGES